jgi:hypothetical protein
MNMHAARWGRLRRPKLSRTVRNTGERKTKPSTWLDQRGASVIYLNAWTLPLPVLRENSEKRPIGEDLAFLDLLEFLAPGLRP